MGSTKNANRHLQRPFFPIGFLIEFWPSLEVSVRYHFPAQALGIQSRSYSKTYFNSNCFSYDFWVSVCLELSVWNCLFGVLTDTLDSKSSIFRFLCPRCLFGAVCLSVCMPVCWFGSLRIRFRAQARGMLNGHLRQGRARSLRRCLLEVNFLRGLEEYWSDTFDKAVLSLLEGVRGSLFSCTGTGNIEQKPSTRLSLSVYQLKGC